MRKIIEESCCKENVLWVKFIFAMKLLKICELKLKNDGRATWHVVWRKEFMEGTWKLLNLKDLPSSTVEDIFCSFIVIFIFVVPCLHKHLDTSEWIYGCWAEALYTWSPLKFIILRYSFGFSMSRLVEAFHRSVRAGTAVTVCTRNI